MKKTLILMFSLLAIYGQLSAQLLSSASKASSTIKNGTVMYKMTVDSKEPQAAMLNNSTFEVAFNGNHSKLVGALMGGMLGGNFIIDGSGKKGLALLNIMGQKKAIRMNSEDITKAQSATSQMNSTNVQHLNETKKIAGYTCKKALIKNPSNPDGHVIVYVCEAIQPESAGLMDNMLKTFKGFPLGFEIKSGDSKISIMASEVSTKIPKKSDFAQDIPTDYQETTMEKLQEEMGGVMGGQ